jgi:hypothetical protein
MKETLQETRPTGKQKRPPAGKLRSMTGYAVDTSDLPAANYRLNCAPSIRAFSI